MQYDFDSIIDRSGTGSLKWTKYANTDVIPMWVADMDFASAPEIMNALRERIDHSIFGYTLPYDSVIESVVHYMQDVHNYSIREEWICWLPGLVPGLNVASKAFGKEGDAIMTATPVYPPFLSAPQNQNKQLITNALIHDGERWTFDFEAMEKSVTPETVMFTLCSPHNPVGRVYSDEELQQLADFCSRHDLILCSDEIHCDLILDKDVRHRCTATLSKELADRTVTLMAPSKTYNIPGLSCSFAIIENDKLRAQFRKAASGFITEINLFGYAGCEAAYRHGEAWRQALIEYLRSNRDFLYTYIKEQMPAISLKPMEATYLAWLNISNLKQDKPDRYFEEHGVGLSSGQFFGDNDYLRLNFGCPRSVLKKGLERMKNAIDKLS